MPVAETLMIGAIGLGGLYFAKKELDAGKKEAPKSTGTTVYNITIDGNASDVGLPDSPAPTTKNDLRYATPGEKEWYLQQRGGPLAAPAGAVRTVQGAATIGGFFNAMRPGVTGPQLGAGVGTGAALGFAQSGTQFWYDLEARKQGVGPYAGKSDAQAFGLGASNILAGGAVGAGSLGLATLDFNRGVTFLGLPIAERAESGHSKLFGFWELPF